MNTYYYLRKSSVTQKFARQELTIPAGGKAFKDTCSGSVAFADRPEASKLLETAKAGDTIIVQHLDRLGRSTANMMHTLEELTKKGVNVRIAGLNNLDSLDADGKPSMMFKLVSGLMSVLAEHEKLVIAERRDAGIRAAKELGNLKYAGRPEGTKDSPEKFLAKHRFTVKAIKDHPELSLKKLSAIARSNAENAKEKYEPSTNTVKRVKEMLAKPAQESI